MAYDNLKLEKGLYTTDKGFTNALEKLDPSENYRGTSLEGLDAYQRQLKRFDIKVSGNKSDTVSKFFQTSDSAALFPEYVSRAVRQGLQEADVVNQMIASTTNIDSLDYRAIETQIDDNIDTEYISEGAFIPETRIQLKETLTPLIKRGRMLVASYEAIKFQKLDVFTVVLKQIGAYIARCQLFDAIQVAYRDVGNVTKLESRKLTYPDLVDLWNSFDPYTMTTIITNRKTAASMLNMTEFQDAAAGLNFHGTGSMITPFGATLIKTSIFNEPTVIGLDKNYAIEKVQAGEVVTDFDKLIDRQLERAAITSIAGFSPIFKEAINIIDC